MGNLIKYVKKNARDSVVKQNAHLNVVKIVLIAIINVRLIISNILNLINI